MTSDPMVDQDIAGLREEIKIVRTDVMALRMQVSLTRWLLILWVVISLVLMVALALVIAGGGGG